MPFVLQPDWVGRRVVVRRVIATPVDGTGARFSDVIGDLLELGPERARLATRAGEVLVELATITRARLVQPATVDILELDRIGARGWRAAETEELNGWLLRADHGFSSRANSVLASTAASPDLDTALGAVTDWYARRGLPVRIHLALPARQLLDAELERRGWPVATEVHVLAARLDVLLDQNHEAPASRVEVTADLRADWLAAYHHPSANAGDPASPEVVRALLTRHDHVGFAALRVDGQLVAMARGTVQDGWLGVTAVDVAPEHRRHGHATELMRELWRWALETQDAQRSYLQVEAGNIGALALYRRLGYWHHHYYRYRMPPNIAS
jgi:ribosomal protein S18 acetylase RimI-like enzyme